MTDKTTTVTDIIGNMTAHDKRYTRPNIRLPFCTETYNNTSTTLVHTHLQMLTFLK